MTIVFKDGTEAKYGVFLMRNEERIGSVYSVDGYLKYSKEATHLIVHDSDKDYGKPYNGAIYSKDMVVKVIQ